MIEKSPHRKMQYSGLLLALFALISCDMLQEPKPPTWQNTIEFPLISESVNLEDLEDEDNIITQLYDANGEKTIFAYADTTEMDSQAVGDQLAFGDITQSFAQSVDDVTVTGSSINQTSAFEPVGVDPIQKDIDSELGPIELSDIPATSTDPFLLSEIFPGVSALLGQTTAIAGGDLEPVLKPFEFTDFSSAVFESGSLDITINNNLAIFLGNPITITLMEVVGSDTNAIPGASVTWSDPIAQNTSVPQSMDLTGVTLPGELLVQVTGSTIGTNGTVITIDASVVDSNFDIDISGSNLVVTSATAKVPSQTIEESGTIDLADSENKIQSAQIKTGSLKIEIVNDMAVASDLVITINSLEDTQGTAFTTTIPIPANTTVPDVSDIAGYSLEMAVAQQQVEYSYSIETEDTGESLVTLSQNDQVSVSISLYGEAVGEQIFFDEITGVIESQLIEEAGDIAISSDSKLLNADISSGSIAIDITNQVNKPGFGGLPTIVLTIPELVDASSNALTGTLLLEADPTNNVLNFNLSNYTLVFPDTATQLLTYTTVVTTPTGELGQYGLEDSIIVDIEVSDMEFASVTGFFTQDALVDSSVIDLDEGTKLIEALFETGNFELTMTNRIGVVADVDFQIDEFIHKTSSEPLQMAFRLENVASPQTSTLDLSDYKLAFASATPGVTQGIHYVSTVSLPSDEEMTLTFGDSILIDVNISELAMESVTGIIEPDTLVIDPDTVSFEMPEMVEDLMFENVNIDIDFNSTFDIPIELTLTLSGTDSTGHTEEIVIVHNLTPDDDVVHIDAADLLNIHPESIISSGRAIISDGMTESTIAKGQGMNPIMYINVPLSLIIEDPPFLELDVTSQDTIIPDDAAFSLDEFVLYADVMNLFEFGATVVVLASSDSSAFDSLLIASGDAPEADTLMSLELLPYENASPETQTGVTEIRLGEDQISLLQDKLFLKPEVQLLGRKDGDGNSIPSRFFSTDSLTIRAWGGVSYTIVGEEL